LSVLPDDILKTDAARITKLDIEMFHSESWKPIYFGIKRSKVEVTPTVFVFRQNAVLPLLMHL